MCTRPCEYLGQEILSFSENFLFVPKNDPFTLSSKRKVFWTINMFHVTKYNNKNTNTIANNNNLTGGLEDFKFDFIGRVGEFPK